MVIQITYRLFKLSTYQQLRGEGGWCREAFALQDLTKASCEGRIEEERSWKLSEGQTQQKPSRKNSSHLFTSFVFLPPFFVPPSFELYKVKSVSEPTFYGKVDNVQNKHIFSTFWTKKYPGIWWWWWWLIFRKSWCISDGESMESRILWCLKENKLGRKIARFTNVCRAIIWSNLNFHCSDEVGLTVGRTFHADNRLVFIAWVNFLRNI